jgi:hypothetical protein
MEYSCIENKGPLARADLLFSLSGEPLNLTKLFTRQNFKCCVISEFHKFQILSGII